MGQPTQKACVYCRTGNSNSEGKRKTVRVSGEFYLSGVNFSEIVIKGKEIYLKLAGNSNYPSLSYRGSNIFRRPVH